MFDRMDMPSRNLAILAIVTGIMVLLAFYALASRTERARPDFEPEPMFKELRARLQDASELILKSKDLEITIKRSEGDIWGLPERGGFPARVEPLRKTLLGLSQLELYKPKTRNPKWHEHLHLKAPGDDGRAVHVTVKDDEGAVLADALIGLKEDIRDFNGLERIHVRRPGEDQTWLARGTLDIDTDLDSWTHTKIAGIPRARIKSAAVNPTELSSFRLTRSSADKEDFKLSPIPKGRAPAAAKLLTDTAMAIAELDLKDVRPSKELAFSKGAAGVYTTFDGLKLTVRTVRDRKDDTFWITLKAEADKSASKPEKDEDGDKEPELTPVQLEAKRINTLAEGWAFKVPEETGKAFDRKLYELIVIARRGRTRR